MATTVNVYKAKTHLSQLLEQVEAGDEVIIARAGKPVAKLVSIASGPRPKRKLGLLAGQLVIPDDFDAPLPDDVLALFEGRDDEVSD